MAEATVTCPPDTGDQPSSCSTSVVNADNNITDPVSQPCVTDSQFSTCPSQEDDPCYSSWCHDSFMSLPPASRVRLMGPNGKCMYRLEADSPGMIMSDGTGSWMFTCSPHLDLPQLVSFVTNEDGSLRFDNNRVPVEGDPPEVGYLMVQEADGGWRKYAGRPDRRSLMIWNGDNWQSVGLDDAGITFQCPDEEDAELKIVGFSHLDCEDGSPNDLKKLSSEADGVLFFDTTNDTVKVTGVCELWNEEAERSTFIPFIPGCSGSSPIKFKGPKDNTSLLYWDNTTANWVVMAFDSNICDPECGCGDHLLPVYDCETATWSITEQPVHVISWKTWSDSGSATNVDFTLPWPAMVQVFAQRRLTPNIGDTTVVTADIYIDAQKVTSPSDGGLVANLGEMSTSLGTAIVPLAKGDHSAYVSNEVVTGGGTPAWNGAWLKVYAHKITECDPPLPSVGAGTGTEGTGGGGGGPAGPAGAQGDPGSEGPQGIPGTPGLDGDVPDDSLECDVLDSVVVQEDEANENCLTITLNKSKHKTTAGVLECNAAGFEEFRVMKCDPDGVYPVSSETFEIITGVWATTSQQSPDCLQINVQMADAKTVDGVLVIDNPSTSFFDVKGCGGGQSYPDYDPSEPTDDLLNQYFVIKMDPSGNVTYVPMDVVDTEICVNGVTEVKQVAVIQ